MSAAKNPYKFLFAGGGTGGHLFPAVAVAQKIKSIIPEADILFIGTKSKIEGRVVPELGFKFRSIWIKGFSRKITFGNLLFPLKLMVAMVQSILINMNFRPKVTIGSGGYVSGPAVIAASLMGSKIMILEQNSFPGVTTRMLEKYADEIHVSFESSKKYFKQVNKVFITGNPVRESLSTISREEALQMFKLNPEKKTVLILGGSLGAGTLNEAAAKSVKMIEAEDINIIWQTGQNYIDKYRYFGSSGIWVNAFINDMNKAYSACDMVVARAGATTIAELLVLGLPSVLVPSPNVAENHQFYNAKALADNNAAIIIEDKEIKDKFFETVVALINDKEKLDELRRNAKVLSKPDAAEVIARQAIQYAQAS
ncbi:MAG: undecaprenyldiphospho-muramoylpentapeptide beta-N-acetylglucosaminyltransferase [Ignavibacteriaceae bacterium]